jgi:hypothetical protein
MIRFSATHNWFRSLLCLMLASGSIAMQAQVQAGATLPAGVPAGFEATPMGYFHPSCVKEVAKDDVIRPDDLAIEHQDGSFDSIPSCAYPHYTARGEKVPTEPRGDDPPFIGHDWIEAVQDVTSSSYGEITTEFMVPPAPASHDGQTIYLFPGMQDINDTKTILQPVLGWNHHYSNAWEIASWNCCTSGTVFVSPYEHTATGHVIYGKVKNQCSAGTLECHKWTVYTKDESTGIWTEIFNESNFGQTFNWVFSNVLEVYNIKRCSDYPEGGKLEAYDVNVYNDKFQKITPSWSLWKVWQEDGDSPVCGYGASWTSSEATIKY